MMAGKVQIKAFDMLGREMKTLVDEYQPAGTYTVPFNSEKTVSNGGIFYYRMTVGNYSKTKKMICIK